MVASTIDHCIRTSQLVRLDIFKVQNRIKKEVGKKGVSESKLKTSLVLNDFGTSSYVSDDFVNSTGSYEAGPSEA